MPVNDPLTKRERDMINSNEPTFSDRPPGIDLPAVFDRLRANVDDELATQILAGESTVVVADLFAVNTFVTNSASGVVMTGTGGNADMEYTVPPGGDGDYLLLWSGNIRSTSAGRAAIAFLAVNGSSVNGTDRDNTLTNSVPCAAQTTMLALVAGDTISARLKRATGGAPFNVEAGSRHFTLLKVRGL